MLEKKKELSIQILKFFEEFLLPRQESDTPWPQGHSHYHVQESNNKGTGGKNRSRGNNENESEKIKQELVFKEDEQKLLNNQNVGKQTIKIMCFDGMERLSQNRKIGKKVWINTSAIILVRVGDYEYN